MALNDWQRSIHSAHRWLMRWLPATGFLPGMVGFLPVTGYHQMATGFRPKHILYPRWQNPRCFPLRW